MRNIFSIFLLSLCLTNLSLMAQDDKSIPYYEIPAYPESYNAGTVAARMVDGLGFRYFWATQDLRSEDLNYKPSEDARSLGETLDHLHGLSLMILAAAKQEANVRPLPKDDMTWEAKRAKTLNNMEKAANIFRELDAEGIAKREIIFQNGDNRSVFPFWNLINGPIADAIYHTGQVVAFRRSVGNPIPKGVNVFMGTKR